LVIKQDKKEIYFGTLMFSSVLSLKVTFERKQEGSVVSLEVTSERKPEGPKSN
jgi:hypothetical protein